MGLASERKEKVINFKQVVALFCQVLDKTGYGGGISAKERKEAVERVLSAFAISDKIPSHLLLYWVGQLQDSARTRLGGPSSDSKERPFCWHLAFAVEGKEFLFPHMPGVKQKEWQENITSKILDEFSKEYTQLTKKVSALSEVSLEGLARVYKQHCGSLSFTQFSIFSGTKLEVVEGLQRRAKDHAGASRETCEQFNIKY